MVDVYAANIAQEISESLINRLMTFLPEDRQQKIKRFHRAEDAKCALLAELLVRTIIHSKLDIKNEEIVFTRNEYGKPLLNHDRDFHFNISHSGIWVMCAAHHLPIGVDIEKIQPIDFNIARRFFSKTEYSDLMNMDSSERQSYFYELWTLKESYIKAVGEGLSIPLDSFSFRVHGNIIEFETGKVSEIYYFKQYNIDKQYKAAVCGRVDDFPGHVEIKGFNEVCDGILSMVNSN